MRVYSPTSTDKWTMCPWLYLAYREGWRQTRHDQRDVAMIAGRAFAVGMAARHVGDTDPAELAREVYIEEVNKVKIGQWAGDITQETLTATLAVLVKAVEYTGVNDPLPPEWVPEAVEQSLGPEAGEARPDVIFKNKITGLRLVRDYKFKLQLDKRWEENTFREYMMSSQALHYLHFTGATFFQPFVVVALPKPHFLYTDAFLERDERSLARWLESQQGKWTAMEAQVNGALPMWENDTHKSKFGPCPMADACLIYNRDQDLMLANGYTREED